MWEMAKTSMALFLKGRLFAHPTLAYRQLAVAILLTGGLMILVGVLGGQLWCAALIAGAIGGATQPYLFKDLRYR